MANDPCRIIVPVTDLVKLLIKTTRIVIKEIFMLGVKEAKIIRDNKILIHLSYTPKKTTLENKFGNLPVAYHRSQLGTKEELTMFAKALKEFPFNLTDDKEEED